MNNKPLYKAALGRVAKLGALYDARTDSFQNDNLFLSDLSGDDIDGMELGESKVEFINSDSIQEKLKALEVEGDLKVSFLVGLLKLSGSGKYLNEERSTSRIQNTSLYYKLRTFHEEINIRSLKDKIDLDVMKPNTDAQLEFTHVVVGIEWGAACSVTCKYEVSEHEDQTAIHGQMQGELQKIKNIIRNSSAKVDYKSGETDKESEKKFTFSCECDVSSRDQKLPITVEDAVEFARGLPNLVEKTNKGKGVPMVFVLKPLDSVIKMCKLPITLNIQFEALSEEIVTKCVSMSAGISTTRRKLSDVQDELKRSEQFVSDQVLSEISHLCEEFDIAEVGYKSKLLKMVSDIRATKCKVGVLEDYIEEVKSTSLSVATYEDKLRRFQDDITKLQTIKIWQDKGVIWATKTENLQKHLQHENVYIFYSENVDSREENCELFDRLQKSYSNVAEYRFVIVDLCLRQDLAETDSTHPNICKYRNGQNVSRDVLATEGSDMTSSFMEFDASQYNSSNPPNDRADVTIRCPNEECSGDPKTWKCRKCKKNVEYGIQTKKFYCKCGMSEVESAKLKFRCDETNHGINFVDYPKKILENELHRLRAIKEKNILILGETGVGKSTWINGIHNYLNFADIQEAIDAPELLALIPSSFTFTSEGESKMIRAGTVPEEERVGAGESVTQEPLAYVFRVGDEKIRLIDTPGIGDSRGIEQDKKNFEKILAYLTNFEEIHAVCILLKPNNSRLTALFRFCIQELLAHLHRSVKDNIVFCFTNSRATFYQPGDTLPPLQKLLREKNIGLEATPHNYFCFDNEPFRFLACVKNGIQFGEDDIETFNKSWERSVKETKRLFAHFNGMKPHRVKNTLSMNESRRIIVAMSKPMAEVAKTVQQNIEAARQKKKEIDACGKTMAEMEKNLKFKGINLTRTELPYPKTVCADTKCVEYENVGETQLQQTIYKQVCHDHCYMPGIPTETIGNPQLQGCVAFSNGECKSCAHHYSKHMHITYELIKTTEEFISTAVQKEILAKKDVKQQKEAFKEKIDEKVKELNKEEKFIFRVSAIYGKFLKENAMIPYNDAMEDFLDMGIEEEQNKPADIRNKDLLDGLNKMKDAYLQEKGILDESMKGGHSGSAATPEEIESWQNKLFELKHFGPTLKKIFDGINKPGRNANYQEKVAPHTPSSAKKSFDGISKSGRNTNYQEGVAPHPSGENKTLIRRAVDGVNKIFSWFKKQ